MNLPNKLTISRVVMAILIIIILLGGDYTVSLFGFEIPKLFINETIVVIYGKEKILELKNNMLS